MTDLLTLSELDDDLVPEILPGSAILSFKVDVKKLMSMFSRAASITPSKEIVPGTSFARLEALPSSTDHVAYLRLTASDGEQTVVMVEDGITLKTPGVVLLPPKRVLDILRLAPTTTIDVTVVGTSALLRSGRARWTVSVPVGDFVDQSVLVDLSSIKTAPVPAQPFLTGLQAARRAASTSNARVSLMQVQLMDSSIIACDGGRLHKAHVEGLDPSINTTIPVKVVDELIKSLQGADSLLFGFNENNLVFQIGSDSIVAQRMLLPFPDVHTLFLAPKLTNTDTLTVDRKELAEAIQRVRINADPDVATVTLSTVRVVPGWQLEIRSRDQVGNTAQESVDCQWSGSPQSMAYNHHHLNDLLSVLQSETVRLKLGKDTKSTRTPLLIEDELCGVTGIVQQVTQH